MNEQLFKGRSIDEFAAAYNALIEPKIGEIARARRAYRVMWAAIAVVILAVGAAIGSGFAAFVDLPLIFWLPVAACAYFAWRAGRFPRALLAQKIRSIIMEPVVRFVGDIRYSHLATAPFDIARFRELELLPPAQRAAHEDIVEGRYREADFRMAELRLTSTRRSRQGDHSRTLFHGLILDIAVPRAFTGRVVLSGAPGRLARVLVDWTRARRGLAQIEFDDPDFARQFRVHASDPALARELLTDAARANLVALALGLSRGKGGLAAAFFDGRFLIALATGRRLIDIGSLLRLTGSIEDDVRRTLRDLTLAHRVIDLLHGDRPERV